jgi:hypothetical protein
VRGDVVRLEEVRRREVGGEKPGAGGCEEGGERRGRAVGGREEVGEPG